MSTLHTERLTLRPWKVDDKHDAAMLFHYASDPHIGPAAAWPPHTSVAESASIIRNVLNAPETYAITFTNDDDPIGSIGLTELRGIINPSTDEQRNAMEIGYWIGKPFWGQGLIPEAAGELLRHGFEDLKLTAIWGTHDVENHKSSRVMDKLGMRMMRIRPHVHLALLGDVFRDEAIRRITKEEWYEQIQQAAGDRPDTK